MSLNKFMKMPDVKQIVKPLRPKPPRRISAALRVEPRSKRYIVVGTAFDYLLRFELQRRAPHATVERWVADSAPEMIWQDPQWIEHPSPHYSPTEPEWWFRRHPVHGYLTQWRGVNGVVQYMDGQYVYLDPDGGEPKTGSRLSEVVGDEKEKAIRARNVVEKAKSAVSAYAVQKSPTILEQVDVAAHSIRLAKLDNVVRGRRLDATFEEAANEDVDDLLAMLGIVTFDTLLHREVLLLNPTFGKASRLVGGADADLIAGDLLVDFKVTKEAEMNVDWLDQLLGYYFLVRHQRMLDPSFPEIKRLGLYFGRHGYLWERDVSEWIDHPNFMDIERWFVSRAKEVFGSNKLLPSAEE